MIGSQFSFNAQKQNLIEQFTVKVSEVQAEAYPKMRKQLQKELKTIFTEAEVELVDSDLRTVAFFGNVPSLTDGKSYTKRYRIAYLTRKVKKIEYYTANGKFILEYRYRSI